jgi:hypothetical protein
MPKAKKENNEQIMEEAEIQVQQPDTVSSSFYKEPAQEVEDTNAKELLNEYNELQEKRKNMKTLYTICDTPYLDAPNKLLSVSGFIPKGTVCYVEKEIYNEQDGNFYQIERGRYINMNWHGVMS